MTMRARRPGPVPDPWKERFAHEVVSNIGKPWKHDRKGTPMRKRRRKPKSY